MLSFENWLLEKRKTKNSPDWHDSDAPDAEGRFKKLGIRALAKWLIKTRKGDLRRIVGSLNQQVVFNRGEDPAYAKKMEKTRKEVYRQLGRKDLLESLLEDVQDPHLIAKEFLSDVSKKYDLREGKPFDLKKGNCSWFTIVFYDWAKNRGLDPKIIYFPHTVTQPHAHIAPMIGPYIMDFSIKQFTHNPDETYKIASPEDYRKFGYKDHEISDELPKNLTPFPLDEI